MRRSPLFEITSDDTVGWIAPRSPRVPVSEVGPSVAGLPAALGSGAGASLVLLLQPRMKKPKVRKKRRGRFSMGKAKRAPENAVYRQFPSRPRFLQSLGVDFRRH